MASLVYQGLYRLYGEGIASSLITFIEQVVKAMADVIESNFLSVAYSIFGAIAATLIILYFFIELTEEAMREMFTFEKLCVAFIKMIAAVAVISCAEDITKYLIQIGSDMFYLIQESIESDAAVATTFDPAGEEAWVEAFQTKVIGGTGILKQLKFFFSHFQVIIGCLIAWILGWVVRIIGYFFAVSAVLTLIVRVFFSPIAVVQIFQGDNSPGLRYLKAILADACSLAGMVVVIVAASYLSSALGGLEIIEATEESVNSAMNLLTVARAAVVQIAAVGGMGSVSRVLHDAFGA